MKIVQLKLITGRGIECGLGIVLLLAGFTKIADLEFFWRALEGAHVFSESRARAIILLLPPLEVYLGFALLLNFERKLTTMLSTGLCACFVTYNLLVAMKGGVAHCGCFGTLNEPIFDDPLIQSIIILAMPVSAMILDRNAGGQLKDLDRS